MKALVLFSGGLDSTTCLAEAVKKYGADNVTALSVFYGQRHDRELKAASDVVQNYGVKWRQLDLKSIFAGADCSLLKSSDETIPKESYAEQLRKKPGKAVSTYVPFRNGLFISCAAAVATAEGCGVIYCGIHKDDAAVNAYPDCGIEFARAIGKAVYIGTGKQVEICTPFVKKTKADIVKRGLQLGVPYGLTWSCYEGGEKPCGKCATCIDRAKAFEKNRVEDPAL